jgi:hypothetical protein
VAPLDLSQLLFPAPSHVLNAFGLHAREVGSVEVRLDRPDSFVQRKPGALRNGENGLPGIRRRGVGLPDSLGQILFALVGERLDPLLQTFSLVDVHAGLLGYGT